MAWIAPTPAPIPDGPLVGEDRPILVAFLAWQRHQLLVSCAGLTGEQLVEHAVPPSNLTLLGLVRHMAKVERAWYRERVNGEQLESMYDPAKGKDADFDDLDPALAAQDFARYAEECRLADVAVADKSFDDTFVLRGETYSLRLVSVHLVAEYSRHNGHADLLRERIDGTTAT